MVKCLIVILALFLPSLASADDGNTLLHDCTLFERTMDGEEIAEDPMDIAFSICKCGGVISATQQSMYILSQMNSIAGNHTSFVKCLPDEGIKNGQLARIVVRYLKNNPSKLNMNDSSLVMMALYDAYPCSKK